MIGEITLINRFLAESKDCPIKGNMGKHDAKHIISVINDEYWKEFVRKLEFAPTSTIYLDELGFWTITYSHFKKYIRDLIKEIRKKQDYLNNVVSKNPDFNPENSITVEAIKDLRKKLSVSWIQLEEQRKLFILRYLLYTYRKKAENPNFIPNKDYTWFPYSFKKELLNNSKVDLSDLEF